MGQPLGADATATCNNGLDLKPGHLPATHDGSLGSGRDLVDRRPPEQRSAMTQPQPAMTVDQLRTSVRDGHIDTVVVAFTDMQGRLQGKRVHAQFFLDTVLEHGTEGCNYLLAVDVDMNTVDGYAISSWERGYGDFEFVLDLDTLHPVPWHPRHRDGRLRPRLAGRRAHARRGEPAADPARPGRAGRREGAGRATRGPSWSSSSSTTPTSRPGPAATGTSPPRTSTTWTTRCSARAGSSRCCVTSATACSAPAWWSSRPRASATSDSTRSPSSTTRSCARPTSTRSTRTAPRRSPRSTARP